MELTEGLPGNVLDAIKAATPLGRFATPDEIANAVTFLASTRRPTSRARSSGSTAASL